MPINVTISGRRNFKFNGLMLCTNGWYAPIGGGHWQKVPDDQAELFVWETFIAPRQLGRQSE